MKIYNVGIAHRALDCQEWFVKSITVVNNTFGVYVNPVTSIVRSALSASQARAMSASAPVSCT
ncbi:MAG TPA: hypothetical protein VJT10_09750 [Steroidobacteraceae bacterium]|nr:hypothetical protein [Steroidobacteraceae bacterium]